MNEILKINNVYRSFGEKNVLNDLSLDIYEGECICIMGRSGCGKSVLMKIIAGLLSPEKGKVFFKGSEVDFNSDRLLEKYRLHFGMVFQNAALFDYLNVYENVGFGLKYYLNMSEKDIYNKVFSVLEELKLKDSAYVFPDQISGGMKKRVALARALVLNPEIIIYDEPTTGLDAVMVRNIDKLIKETQKLRKTTSVVITHDLNSTMRIADRIAIHSGGKILEVGDKETISNSKLKDTRLILNGTIDE